MQPHEKYDAILRCAVILRHARAGNWHAVGHDVNELAHLYDGRGIQLLIMGCADTMIAHQGGPLPAGQLVAPLWIDCHGTTTDASGVNRPEVVWAGQFIAAHAAQDTDTCAALVNSCADDPGRYADNVLAVIEVTAYTLNSMNAPV